MGNKKDKELAKVMDDIRKTYGESSVMLLDDSSNIFDGEVIDTGSLTLNEALGTGGFPKGRIVEIYGPESSGKTTLTIHAIANAQKNGDVCAFIDAEHAFDKTYAQNLGVDTSNLIISQPDNGEQALEITERLIRSNKVGLVVVDSVAALTPKAEIEGEMGDSKIGLQARLMSQAMRKLTSAVSRSKCCLIFINQIRMKIGVMFGCFPYTTRVELENGETMKIGKIVNNKLPLKVKSWNKKTGKIEYKKIVNWYNNGKYEHLWKVGTKSPHKSGNIFLRVADDHTFITKTGDRRLSDLKVGDNVLTTSKSYLNKDQKSVILGGILGDGSLRTLNGITYRYRETHSSKQNEYCKWKSRLLGEIVSTEGVTGKNEKFYFETHAVPELGEYDDKNIDRNFINSIDKISLAIWYLDDGTFSGSYEKWGHGKSEIACTRFSRQEKIAIAYHLKESFGLDCTVTNTGLLFSGENNKKFQQTIVEYVPKCMSYKIHPKLRTLCETYSYNTKSEEKDVLVEVPILSKDKVKSIRSPYKYDIEVEGNSNYFVSGVLVHNSPETTSGGEALKFYCSQRLDIRRIGSMNKDKEGVGVSNNHKVKVIKNKLAAPYRIAEFSIRFGTGIDRNGEVVDLGVDFDIIDKAGSWYSYDDVKIGQGRENAIQMLEDNPDLALEIEEKLINKLKA